MTPTPPKAFPHSASLSAPGNRLDVLSRNSSRDLRPANPDQRIRSSLYQSLDRSPGDKTFLSQPRARGLLQAPGPVSLVSQECSDGGAGVSVLWMALIGVTGCRGMVAAEELAGFFGGEG